MRNDPAMYYQEQVEQWQVAIDEEDNEQNKQACRQLWSEAASLNAQFQRILYAYFESGSGGLTLKSEHNYCVVLSDATEPGRFRYQTFNETGFIGHTTRDSVEEVLLEAFRDGFRNIETKDVLDQFSQTLEWEKGSLVNDLVRKVNCGDLTQKEAHEQFEVEVARIYAKPELSSVSAAY